MVSGKIGRRKFLGILGGLAAAVGVSGFIWQALRPTEKPAKQVKSNAYTQNGKSLVSIVKGNSDNDVEAMVREAVDAIGGMGKIVSSGNTVVVKPALLAPDPECAPDPRVVAAVVKLAREAGGTVIVAECSGLGPTSYNLEQVGITSAAQAAGAEVRPLDRADAQPIQMQVPNGIAINNVATFQTIYDCDAIISVPRLKRHGMATVTISLKNMMGVITQREMGRFHNIDFSQCVADLNTVLKPDLCVVDATYAMAGDGPRIGGTEAVMIRMDTIMASGDPVAMDTVAAQRLRELEMQNDIETFAVSDVRHINLSAAQGVGTNDPNQIAIIERNLI